MLIDPPEAVKIIASLYFRFLLRFTFLKINEVVMTSSESCDDVIGKLDDVIGKLVEKFCRTCSEICENYGGTS